MWVVSVCPLVVPPRQQMYWRHMRGHWKMIIHQTMSDTNTVKCCCIRCQSHIFCVSWKCGLQFFFLLLFKKEFSIELIWGLLSVLVYIYPRAIQICLFILVWCYCFSVSLCSTVQYFVHFCYVHLMFPAVYILLCQSNKRHLIILKIFLALGCSTHSDVHFFRLAHIQLLTYKFMLCSQNMNIM